MLENVSVRSLSVLFYLVARAQNPLFSNINVLKNCFYKYSVHKALIINKFIHWCILNVFFVIHQRASKWINCIQNWFTTSVIRHWSFICSAASARTYTRLMRYRRMSSSRLHNSSGCRRLRQFKNPIYL